MGLFGKSLPYCLSIQYKWRSDRSWSSRSPLPPPPLCVLPLSSATACRIYRQECYRIPVLARPSFLWLIRLILAEIFAVALLPDPQLHCRGSAVKLQKNNPDNGGNCSAQFDLAPHGSGGCIPSPGPAELAAGSLSVLRSPVTIVFAQPTLL